MDHFQAYYALSLRFLSYRARSIKEMRDRLVKKKAPDDVIEKLISLLIDQKLLNDQEFAQSWVESRLRARPKAMSVIKQELIQKGISREILEELLSDTKEFDRGSIKKVIEKAKKKYSNLEIREQKEKIAGYLGRRGYSWDVISKELGDISQE